jgi:hypothetical protein
MIRRAFAALALASAVCLAAESSGDFKPLFAPDFSNAINTKNVWSVIEEGVITASADEPLWSKDEYENFVVDLDFKSADGTNSGVMVYCTDPKNWIPNSVEIQIADDFAEKWAKAPKSWQCAAIFGRKAPTKSVVKKPGEWNHMTITCKGQHITVVLNGEQVNDINMADWKSATKNPDGTDIPKWLNGPLAEMATKGRIGFQGKHAGAPIYFKNIRIKAAPGN